MNRWVIVSNRLPFQINREKGELIPSSGGLVSALKGVKGKEEMIWVGSLESEGDTRKLWNKTATATQKKQNHPIYVPSELYAPYYDSICNGLLWPTFHYETSHDHCQPSDWQAYQAVNEQFADSIASMCKPDDLIWIHDYHLFLVPGMLRKRCPNQLIGFFLHIPFPSSEIFRTLPMREEILDSLIDADLVGFHDYSYVRHFASSAYHVLGVEHSLMHLSTRHKKTEMGVFPVSIETNRFRQSVKAKKTQSIIKKLKKQHKDRSIILGVDRQDYTKGLELKLEAYDAFLTRYPEYHEKVKLIQIAVPSRIHTPDYQLLKEQIDRLCGEINSRYGTLSWTPVQYLFTGVPFETLVALYREADVLLVSSKRDGMNLVSLEYIACQDQNDPGTLVLSEFAGSAGFLNTPIMINPWDREGTADRLKEALELPLSERKRRNQVMFDFLKSYSSSDWASSFMTRLSRLEEDSAAERKKRKNISPTRPETIARRIKNKPTLLLLDYDGTLVGIKPTPAEAVLNDGDRKIIQNVTKLPDYMVIVVSGRDSQFMTRQFKDVSVGLACEHGGRFRPAAGRRWNNLVSADTEKWFPIVESIMEDFCKRTPGAFIEKKRFALSWHYRQSSEHFSEYQARRLAAELHSTLSSLPVSILNGKKVVEARAAEANKGHFVRWLFDNVEIASDMNIVAIGDDRTDEDMFTALPENALTIKVGLDHSNATYRFESSRDVYRLLTELGL